MAVLSQAATDSATKVSGAKLLRRKLTANEYSVLRQVLNCKVAERPRYVKSLADEDFLRLQALANVSARSLTVLREAGGWEILTPVAALCDALIDAVSGAGASSEVASGVHADLLAAEPLLALLATPLDERAPFEAQKACVACLLGMSGASKACQNRLGRALAEDAALKEAYQRLVRGAPSIQSYPVQALSTEFFYRTWRLWHKKAPGNARIFEDVAAPALCEGLAAVNLATFDEDLRILLNRLNGANQADARIASFPAVGVFRLPLGEGGGGGGEARLGSLEWLDVGKDVLSAEVVPEKRGDGGGGSDGNVLLSCSFDAMEDILCTSIGGRHLAAFTALWHSVGNLHHLTRRVNGPRAKDRCRIAFEVAEPRQEEVFRLLQVRALGEQAPGLNGAAPAATAAVKAKAVSAADGEEVVAVGGGGGGDGGDIGPGAAASQPWQEKASQATMSLLLVHDRRMVPSMPLPPSPPLPSPPPLAVGPQEDRNEQVVQEEETATTKAAASAARAGAEDLGATHGNSGVAAEVNSNESFESAEQTEVSSARGGAHGAAAAAPSTAAPGSGAWHQLLVPPLPQLPQQQNGEKAAEAAGDVDRRAFFSGSEESFPGQRQQKAGKPEDSQDTAHGGGSGDGGAAAEENADAAATLLETGQQLAQRRCPPGGHPAAAATAKSLAATAAPAALRPPVSRRSHERGELAYEVGQEEKEKGVVMKERAAARQKISGRNTVKEPHFGWSQPSSEPPLVLLAAGAGSAPKAKQASKYGSARQAPLPFDSALRDVVLFVLSMQEDA